MSVSGVSDLLEPGLDDDEALTGDFVGDQDEDGSLLDAALGDVSTGEKDHSSTPPEEAEPGDNILDDTTDSVQLEEDPVSVF